MATIIPIRTEDRTETDVTQHIDAKAAIALAKKEIHDENLKKAVTALKEKYRQRVAASAVVENIDREIANLELKIEQGNI